MISSRVRKETNRPLYFALLFNHKPYFQMKIWPYFLPVINFLRTAIPAVSLFGSAPTFFIFWFSLRLITNIAFPRHIYRRCDDYLYSLYQQFVLFFFENWIKVKIYFHGDYEEIMKKKENVLYIANHQSSGKIFLDINRKIQ